MLLYVSGCVELPESEPPRTDYRTEVRIINVDASIDSAVVSMAAGPDFGVYADLPMATLVASTPYVAYPAGGKKLFLRTPFDPDTAALTFPPDGRGTLYIIPRRTASDDHFMLLYERYSFVSTVGRPDTTRIRFLNYVSTGDTVDIRRVTDTTNTLAVDNLRFGRTSSFLNVHRSDTVKFYLTFYTATAPIDSLTVVGGSYKVFDVIAYDSLARAKFCMFEEN
jgi:hypothetical protein